MKKCSSALKYMFLWAILLVTHSAIATDDVTDTGQDQRPSSTGAPRIEYTIWNDSNLTVRFRLPSGRDYSLKPGKRGSYDNTGRNLKIKVYNSGRTYNLSSGDHKFFWNSSKGRIGFDKHYNREVTFKGPKVGGYYLDYCREWGKNCGWAAAHAFCKSKGYKKATNFRKHTDAGYKTRVINGGQVCDAGYCDRISRVECQG